MDNPELTPKQHDLKWAIERAKTLHRTTGMGWSDIRALDAVLAAAESLLSGVPCRMQRRGPVTHELIIGKERYLTASLPCSLHPGEVVDAVIVRLPKEQA